MTSHPRCVWYPPTVNAAKTPPGGTGQWPHVLAHPVPGMRSVDRYKRLVYRGKQRMESPGAEEALKSTPFVISISMLPCAPSPRRSYYKKILVKGKLISEIIIDRRNGVLKTPKNRWKKGESEKSSPVLIARETHSLSLSLSKRSRFEGRKKRNDVKK